MQVIIFIIMVALIVSIPIFKVNSIGNKYIVNISDLNNISDKVVILGAGIGEDGKPCDLLKDRIKTAMDVYLKGYSNKILITADNYGEEYNEVAAIKDWIIDNYSKIHGLEDAIVLDNNGFSTIDSIYRAKYIFNARSIIICTNEYHLQRAIYIARCLEIEVLGVKSDLRVYDRLKKYKIREVFAKIKDFYLANYIKNRMK